MSEAIKPVQQWSANEAFSVMRQIMPMMECSQVFDNIHAVKASNCETVTRYSDVFVHNPVAFAANTKDEAILEAFRKLTEAEYIITPSGQFQWSAPIGRFLPW